MSVHAVEGPLVNVSINVGRSRYEVGERTDHSLVMSNQSSEVLSLPSFRFMDAKQEDSEIAFYLQRQVLHMQVTRGTDAIAIHPGWLEVPAKAEEFPTVELRPGECMAVPFSLTRRWYPSFYSLTNPGAHAVRMTLDTTKTANAKVVKGVFVSAPARFEIIPVPTFRTRNTGETKSDYARERVAFYLKRIAERRGEYFVNAGSIVYTEAGVPALIELRESGDTEVRSQADSVLEQIHHPETGRSDHPVLPVSRQAWHAWWEQTGSKMSTADIWRNFESHFP